MYKKPYKPEEGEVIGAVGKEGLFVVKELTRTGCYVSPEGKPKDRIFVEYIDVICQ